MQRLKVQSILVEPLINIWKSNRKTYAPCIVQISWAELRATWLSVRPQMMRFSRADDPDHKVQFKTRRR